MSNLEKDIIEYIEKCLSEDEIKESSVETLAFSFLLGLPPIECKGMYPEEEWTQDELNEYDDVVNYIYRYKKSHDM